MNPKINGVIAGYSGKFTFDADDVVEWCSDQPVIMSREQAEQPHSGARQEISKVAKSTCRQTKSTVTIQKRPPACRSTRGATRDRSAAPARGALMLPTRNCPVATEEGSI
jgi:hypothetical protein